MENDQRQPRDKDNETEKGEANSNQFLFTYCFNTLTE